MKPSDTRLQRARVWSAVKLVQLGIAIVAYFRTFLYSHKAAGWSVFVRVSVTLRVKLLYSAYSALSRDPFYTGISGGGGGQKPPPPLK